MNTNKRNVVLLGAVLLAGAYGGNYWWQNIGWPTAESGTPATLFAAAEQGDALATRRALWHGADPATKDAEGRTALALAAARGHGSVVELLLARGSDPNTRDKAGRTPLLAATDPTTRADASSPAADLETLRLLFAAGAEVDAREHREGATALMLAAHAGAPGPVELLLACGANPNAQDLAGTTVLCYASTPEVAEILLQQPI